MPAPPDTLPSPANAPRGGVGRQAGRPDPAESPRRGLGPPAIGTCVPLPLRPNEFGLAASEQARRTAAYRSLAVDPATRAHCRSPRRHPDTRASSSPTEPRARRRSGRPDGGHGGTCRPPTPSGGPSPRLVGCGPRRVGHRPSTAASGPHAGCRPGHGALADAGGRNDTAPHTVPVVPCGPRRPRRRDGPTATITAPTPSALPFTPPLRPSKLGLASPEQARGPGSHLRCVRASSSSRPPSKLVGR